MSFRINSNMGAINAYNQLAKANNAQQTAQLRLASRKRINSVSDDVSGFNVGKSLSSKVSIMQSAQGNISSAKDMLSTAENALLLVKDKLTQIRSYVADASDATKDRQALAENIKSLGNEIKNIFETTKFNNTHLLMGKTAMSSLSSTASASDYATSLSFQTGVDATDRLTLDFAKDLATGGAVGTASTTNLAANVANAITSFTTISSTTDDATSAAAISNLATGASTSATDTQSIIGKFEKAVNDSLGKIGNLSQRLDVKDEYLTSAISNAQSSVSRLFDADMAMEQLNATKAQIGGQVATSMLGQLNYAPQNILSLFG
jgi:flagellin